MSEKKRSTKWDRWIILFFVLLAAWPLAQSLFSISEWRYSYALELQKRGDLSASRAIFENLLKQSPGDLPISFRLAEIAVQQERFEDALEILVPFKDNLSFDNSLQIAGVRIDALIALHRNEDALEVAENLFSLVELDDKLEGGLNEEFYSQLAYPKSRRVVNLVAYISAITNLKTNRANGLIQAVVQRMTADLDDPRFAAATLFELSSRYADAFRVYQDCFEHPVEDFPDLDPPRMPLQDEEIRPDGVTVSELNHPDLGRIQFLPLTIPQRRMIVENAERHFRKKTEKEFSKAARSKLDAGDWTKVESRSAIQSMESELGNLTWQNLPWRATVKSGDRDTALRQGKFYDQLLPYVFWYVLHEPKGQLEIILSAIRTSHPEVSQETLSKISNQNDFLIQASSIALHLTVEAFREERLNNQNYLANRLRLLARKLNLPDQVLKYERFLKEKGSHSVEFNDRSLKVEKDLLTLRELQHYLDTQAMVQLQLGRALKQLRTNRDPKLLSGWIDDQENLHDQQALKLINSAIELGKAIDSYDKAFPPNYPIILPPTDELRAGELEKRYQAIELYHLSQILEENGRSKESKIALEKIRSLGFEPNHRLF